LPSDFLKSPAFHRALCRTFFSEYDLRSYLYHLLINKPLLGQEYVSANGIPIAIVHAEYPVAAGGRLDIAVLDAATVGQVILCGMEIGLNRSYAHFEKDYAWSKFVAGAQNNVMYGYVIHFVRGDHKDWKTIVENVKESAEAGDCAIIQILDQEKAKVAAVRIRIAE
jgi:hypothetical protein